ncbi:hypothetical protein [Variovorax rhizosphaerae]|uniref:Uncharacterized protein n=1 Tax=Variovorax rhizosphaerae TaxID=1836200 RepID=A0ABU8WFU4_9BURK
MPNPGKPLALKQISGSRRVAKAFATVTLPALQEVPSAPEWLLNDHARAEWSRLARILTNSRILTVGALVPLAHVCNLHGVIARQLTAGGQPKAAMVGLYRLMLNDFGLTPAFQGKVTPAPAGASANRFSDRGCPPGLRRNTIASTPSTLAER